MAREGLFFLGGWVFGYIVLWASNKVHSYKRRRTHHEDGLP